MSLVGALFCHERGLVFKRSSNSKLDNVWADLSSTIELIFALSGGARISPWLMLHDYILTLAGAEVGTFLGTKLRIIQMGKGGCVD